MAALQSIDFEGEDISDNEMAKTHARYIVGGRSEVAAKDERLYRFEFPERPGALIKFLTGMQTDWNISLFHYRNHGGDVASILSGIQVPPAQTEAFTQYLEGLDYPFIDETENSVYKKFMK